MAIFQHKYDKVCPTSVLINFSLLALRDSLGGPAALVLMNAAEVAVATDPKGFWADREGKLWLMTYPQFSEILAASPASLNGDLSLVLHMGCGQYTYDIGHEEGFEKPIVWVYTVSNLEESIFRDAAASGLRTGWRKGPQLEWLQPEAFGAAVASLREEDLKHKEDLERMAEEHKDKPEMLEQLPEPRKRAVVFTSMGKLLEAYDQHGCPRRGYAEASGVATGQGLANWVDVLLEPEHRVQLLLVKPNVGTVGTLRNLNKVLVLPVRDALFFDGRVSHVVSRKDMPMSQAEVRYACRVACSPVGSVDTHTVSIFAAEAEFGSLPPAPVDPMAFTGDLPAVLLHLCDHSYFDGGKVSPIRLPRDEEMTNEYLRRLELRGLTESRGGPLTSLGRLTSWWYHTGIRDFNVANLLAIASTAQGARAGALLQIAAVLYHPDTPVVSPIASLLRFRIPEGRSAEFHNLFQKRVGGFAEKYVARGPIWRAVAFWAARREGLMDDNERVSKDFFLCENMVEVSAQTLKIIQSNWTTMGQAWTAGTSGAEVDEKPSISEEDFLFLEESVVRVFMHNLVLVGMEGSGLGEFACDLTSGSPVARPDNDLVNWALLAKDAESQPADGGSVACVFAVYTSLSRSTGPDGRIRYVPQSLTFVSTRAVRRVLREVATSKGRVGSRLPSWRDLLRTEYPICYEPGEL